VNKVAARCPECLAELRKVQPHQIFCSTTHKRAYNNRWLTRGAVLAPLQAAGRYTRYGSRGDQAARETGRKASRDANSLLQRWLEEDRAAGRMPTVDYVALRYRHGLVEIA
jgi:endogenous inhibitor of DNA gyrase (YacG/DUF329 family)